MRMFALVTVALLALLATATGRANTDAPVSSVMQSGATPPAADEISVESLAAPGQQFAGTEGATIALYRISVPVAAAVQNQPHPGVSIWYIESGSITYTVESGEAWGHCADGCLASGTPAARSAEVGEEVFPVGTEVRLEAGDWVVQYEDIELSYRNTGDAPAVILLSAIHSEPAMEGCAGGCE